MYIIIVLILTAMVILPILMYREANKLNIKHETVTLPISINEMTILFVTDIHKRKIDRNLFQEIPKVDFVIIGGDVCEVGLEPGLLDDNLSTLTSFGKTLFVWGNNDYEYGEKELNHCLEKHGILALNNDSITIDGHLGKWTIAGVEDLGQERTNVQQALSNSVGPVLLVAHNPEVAYLLREEHKNVQAILSGHTHGGQIRLGPFSISEKGGWKVKNKFPVLISNGFGTTRIHLRFGAVPEVHLVTIKSDT
ncbi:metallophosphoesterase [Salipaludibacillus daqingensis]|uniref:metallophosphoesterase n=1 Tax=Salipaludibacillus daqingensis TaxID=3041001 RepID=UPI00247303E4|nr:metallophosphoesterase [Salipaludibacillus daqingensis]